MDARKLQDALDTIAQQADAAFVGTLGILETSVRGERLSHEEATEIADAMVKNFPIGRHFDFEKIVRNFLPNYRTPLRRQYRDMQVGNIQFDD